MTLGGHSHPSAILPSNRAILQNYPFRDAINNPDASFPAGPGLLPEHGEYRRDDLIKHVLRDIPVGTRTSGTRRERDSFGSVDVPADRYWGAGTQRSLKILPCDTEALPEHFYRCCGYVKKAAAIVNARAGRLPLWKTAAIARAADDLIGGLLVEQFPLPVWQAGSGRDADTNVNEVLANRASQLLGRAIGNRRPIDPTRDVNMGQSLGRTFTASMQIVTVIEIEQTLAVRGMALARALERHGGIASAHARRVRASLGRLDEAEGNLHEIGIGPSNDGIVPQMTEEDWRILVGTIAAATARPFIISSEAFSDCASPDAMVAAMAAIRGLAVVLSDVAAALQTSHDTRREAVMRAPTEAMAMVCMHIIGQDHVVAAAACQGHRLQNTMRPLVVASVLKAIHHLGEACGAISRVVSQSR